MSEPNAVVEGQPAPAVTPVTVMTAPAVEPAPATTTEVAPKYSSRKRLYNIEYKAKNKEILTEKMKKYRSEHSEEIRENARKYYQSNKEKIRNYDLSRRGIVKASRIKKYGISIDFYNELLKNQGNKCAICECTCSGTLGDSYCVDHDHKTGVIRGVLCGNCNLALGHIKDDKNIAWKMIDYLCDNFSYKQVLI